MTEHAQHDADLELDGAEAETAVGGMQPPNPGIGDRVHDLVDTVEAGVTMPKPAGRPASGPKPERTR